MLASRSFDPATDRGVVRSVHQGDCLVSAEMDVTFSTILGSCVSACIRDREAMIGGMNHFLLAEPAGLARDRYGASSRYGAFAMEQLINKVLSQGSGRKANLEIKVFGGGLINAALSDIGAKNIEFIRDFVANEGYPLAGEDLGGTYARRVMFRPSTGRAFVKRLDAADGAGVARAELSLVDQRAATASPVDDIELFNRCSRSAVGGPW
jgi:chemotaxis protein CheD